MPAHPVTPPFALHVCCAPCLITASAAMLAGAGLGPAKLFFYNPNIHPLLEFRRRTKALLVYLERHPAQAVIEDEYGLRTFLTTVGQAPRPERCRLCYLLRLERTARFARAEGLPAFTTTLLASREQDRAAVADAGRQAGRKFGVTFLDEDLRSVVPAEAAFRGIYRQQYCGCVFSEEERWRDGTKHLYRGGAADDEGTG